jgi:hypothetical protein
MADPLYQRVAADPRRRRTASRVVIISLASIRKFTRAAAMPSSSENCGAAVASHATATSKPCYIRAGVYEDHGHAAAVWRATRAGAHQWRQLQVVKQIKGGTGTDKQFGRSDQTGGCGCVEGHSGCLAVHDRQTEGIQIDTLRDQLAHLGETLVCRGNMQCLHGGICAEQVPN